MKFIMIRILVIISLISYFNICCSVKSKMLVISYRTARKMIWYSYMPKNVKPSKLCRFFQLPHKHEFVLSKECMATVGRLSHAEFHNKIFGSAQMHRRFGYKMASGLFQKKDGYLGRKIRRLPPPRT